MKIGKATKQIENYLIKYPPLRDDDNRLIDPGYSVVVDSTINPASQLAGGLVKAQVGVRVSGVADLIQVTISKSNLTTPVI